MTEDQKKHALITMNEVIEVMEGMRIKSAISKTEAEASSFGKTGKEKEAAEELAKIYNADCEVLMKMIRALKVVRKEVVADEL